MVFSPYSKNSFQGIKIQYIYHVPIYIYIRPRWNYSTNQTLHPYLPLPSLSPTVRRNTAATSIRFTGTFLDDDISPRIPLINSYLPRFSIRGLPSQFRGSREIYYTPQTDNAKSTPPPPSPSPSSLSPHYSIRVIGRNASETFRRRNARTRHAPRPFVDLRIRSASSGGRLNRITDLISLGPSEICANLLIAERFNEIRRRRKFSVISKLTRGACSLFERWIRTARWIQTDRRQYFQRPRRLATASHAQPSGPEAAVTRQEN